MRDLRTLVADNEFVNCVALSPDGRMLASGDAGRGVSNKAIELSDGMNGKTLRKANQGVLQMLSKRACEALVLSLFLTSVSQITQVNASGLQKPKEKLKTIVETKYTSGFVEFVQNGLYVGEYGEAGVITDKFMKLIKAERFQMSTEYYHFYDGTVSDSDYKKFALKKATPLSDGKTFQHADGGYQGSAIEPLNERLNIVQLKIHDSGLSFYLKADQMRHGGAGATTARSDKTYGSEEQVTMQGRRTESERVVSKGKWGVAYHFIFPKEMIEKEEFDRMFTEIDRILLDTGQAQLLKQKSATSVITPTIVKQDEQKRTRTSDNIPKKEPESIEIKPGMTRQQVISALGQPQKSVKFGVKEILTYPDLSVVLMNGKVSSVR